MKQWCLIFIFLLSNCEIKSQTNFRIRYTDPRLYRHTTIFSLNRTADNEYGFFGYSNSSFNVTQYPQPFIGKITENGFLSWSKYYYSPDFLYQHTFTTHIWWRYNFSSTADGGFIVTGGILDTADYSAAFLLKISQGGDVEWSKLYSYPNQNTTGFSVFETFDHNYILLGGISKPGFSSKSFFMTVSKQGIFMNAQKYIEDLSRPYGDYMEKAIPTSDHGYAYVSNDGVLFKLDSTGSIQWISSHEHQNGYSPTLIETKNHDIICAGRKLNSNLILTSYTNSGIIKWTTSLDWKYGFSECNKMLEDNSGNLIVPTQFLKDSLLNSEHIACINKFDSSGKYLSSISFNDSTSNSINFYTIEQLCLTSDNHYLGICGYSKIDNEDNDGFVYIKLDSALNNDCETDKFVFSEGSGSDSLPYFSYHTSIATFNYKSIDIIAVDELKYVDECRKIPDTSDQKINAFPNPVNNKINVSLNNGYFHSIYIYNTIGQLITKAEFQTEGIKISNYETNLSFLSQGIYILKVQTNEKILICKILKT